MSGALLAAAGTMNARFCLLYYAHCQQFLCRVFRGTVTYLLVPLNDPVSVPKDVVVEVLDSRDSSLPMANNGDVLGVCRLPCVVENEQRDEDKEEGSEDAPGRQGVGDVGVKASRHGGQSVGLLPLGSLSSLLLSLVFLKSSWT